MAGDSAWSDLWYQGFVSGRAEPGEPCGDPYRTPSSCRVGPGGVIVSRRSGNTGLMSTLPEREEPGPVEKCSQRPVHYLKRVIL